MERGVIKVKHLVEGKVGICCIHELAHRVTFDSSRNKSKEMYQPENRLETLQTTVVIALQ